MKAVRACLKRRGHKSVQTFRSLSSTCNDGGNIQNAYTVLKERGFVKESTANLESKLASDAKQVTFYVGFDPSADSLHVGSLVPLMAMSHLQRAGHRPIALLGGATGMVGDPSGKDEARQLLTKEAINENKASIKAQIERFIDLGDENGILVDNADWLLNLNYINFLREYGSLLSVNAMLSKASVKSRLQKGMSFLEFNYQILQAYDYLELNRRYGCTLQIGGDDQWGNIVSGIDLIRKKSQKEAEALTFPLLTTANGSKMGKTANGAVWLDAAKVSPYDYYQFWINVDDRDLTRFLQLFTFLDMDEIRKLDRLQGADLRHAKQILAYEATCIMHGADAAAEAKKGAQAAFSGKGDISKMPLCTVEFPIGIVALLSQAGLSISNKDARRTIKSGAIRVNGEKIFDNEFVATESLLDDKGGFQVQKGNKKRVRVVSAPK